MSFFESASNTAVFDGKFVNAHKYQEVHVHSEPVTSESLRILKDWTVPGAFHNSGERFDPPKCHPDTRVAVIDRIKRWADQLEGTKEKPIFWLYGPAGAGKSAIAQTLAEVWHEEGCLAASFFFSRTGTTGKRGEKTHLVATIVYQLLISFPELRPWVHQVLSDDPLIFEKSLEMQVLNLIVNPLRQLFPTDSDLIAPTKIVIIDGLDECHGAEAQEEIIDLWASVLQERNLPLILLLASRPEPHISERLTSRSLQSMSVHLTLNNEWDPSRDIMLFLECWISEIKEKRPWLKRLSWPPEDAIDTITRKSSGQFIYASTVIKFITSPRCDPRKNLDIILGLEPPTLERPFMELDTLYQHILFQVPHSSIDIVMNVFACVAAPHDEFSDRYGPWMYPTEGYFAGRNARTPASLEKFLLLQPGELHLHLMDLHALLHIPPIERAEEDPITLYHASFADFLSSEDRAGWFYLGIMERNARMATCIWKHTLIALSDGSDSERLLPDQPLKTVSTRERIFTMYLEMATPSIDMMSSIDAALGSSESSYFEACKRMGIEHRVTSRKFDLFSYISSCDLKWAILQYLQECRIGMRIGCWPSLLYRFRMFLWRRQIDKVADRCRNNCLYHESRRGWQGAYLDETPA